MKIENIIYKKRCLELAVKKHNDKESINLLKKLLEEYYKTLDLCCHNIYCDNGYYKYHNGEVYLTDKAHADFRSLICPKCNKEITLLKTENENWDTEILGEKLQIISPLQLDYKELDINLLYQKIITIFNEYYNLKQKSCNHIEFINNGYYSMVGGLQKSTRGRAEFRIVTCTCCKKSYLLPNTKNKYWDVTIEDKPISVYEPQDEKSKKYIISM